jgi:wyosine [tRNA(Phe)-imidazoG37] synthetase (radical SAM superfamily)
VIMTQVIYDKANSILEIRGIEEKREVILRYLRTYYHKVDRLSKEDSLRKVLEDLFGDFHEDSQPAHFFLRDHVVEEMARLDPSYYERYLRYRYAYEVYPITHHVDRFPPLVQIEPTSICNYRCVFCYQIDPRLSNKKNGHMGVMDHDTFKKIIDQLEGNIEGVTLASRGEPTVNKNLSKMLAYMSGKFLATKVNTNAFLLDEKMSHAILEADLQTLVFSADAAAEPLYSQLRVNGDLERVVKNVELFHEIKEKYYSDSKLITRVSGVRFSGEQDIRKMEQFWSRYVDQVAFVDYNPWENVYDAKKKSIDAPCSDLWRRLFIWWDGKVAPCDVDYLTTLSGETLQQSSVSEIWNSEMYQKLRQSQLAGDRQKLEPCSRCVVV